MSVRTGLAALAIAGLSRDQQASEGPCRGGSAAGAFADSQEQRVRVAVAALLNVLVRVLETGRSGRTARSPACFVPHTCHTSVYGWSVWPSSDCARAVTASAR